MSPADKLAPSDSTSSPRFAIAGVPLTAIAFLLLTVVISLVWSHYKLIRSDEFNTLLTDSAGGFGRIVHIQLTDPLMLDPLVYHALVWLVMRVIAPGALAIRLPALCGYLLMQLCIFKFVRRFAADNMAIFAMAFPAATATLYYSAEGRPYGLVLGLFGLAMVCWQTAIRDASRRTPAIIGLALVIALTLNTHYYGVLLLAPLCLAELCRILQRRRIDWPMLAAIAIGSLGIAAILPFIKPAAQYRQHYYTGDNLSYHAIMQGYRSLLVNYTSFSLRTQHLLAAALLLFTLLLLFGCIRQLRAKAVPILDAELAFLLGMVALPFFGYVMARLVTHSIEPRCVLGAIIGVTVLVAITLAPLFRSGPCGRIALGVLFVAIALSGITRIQAAKRATQQDMAALVVSPAVEAAILVSPTQRLYMQDLGEFEIATHYEQDPDIRARFAIVYSRDEELRWDQHDTITLSEISMQQFTPFTFLPYESVSKEPGDHIFVLRHDGWNWTDGALAEQHAVVQPIGKGFGGDVAAVRFHH